VDDEPSAANQADIAEVEEAGSAAD
jgi:hypothetical protein